MTIQVGIALHFVAAYPASYFHWVLVVSPVDSWSNLGISDVLSMEIKKGTDDIYHHSFEPEKLVSSESLKGIVHLFSTDKYSVESLSAMLQTKVPADYNSWRLPGGFGPQGWTCATWVLKALDFLRQDAVWPITDYLFERAYTKVLNLGAKMLEDRRSRGIQIYDFTSESKLSD